LFLRGGISLTFCSGWPRTMILLISGSWGVRIVDVSHCAWSLIDFCKLNYKNYTLVIWYLLNNYYRLNTLQNEISIIPLAFLTLHILKNRDAIWRYLLQHYLKGLIHDGILIIGHCVAINIRVKIILTKDKIQNKIRLQLKNIYLEETIS
jgi:hypothetical protein